MLLLKTCPLLPSRSSFPLSLLLNLLLLVPVRRLQLLLLHSPLLVSQDSHEVPPSQNPSSPRVWLFLPAVSSSSSSRSAVVTNASVSPSKVAKRLPIFFQNYGHTSLSLDCPVRPLFFFFVLLFHSLPSSASREQQFRTNNTVQRFSTKMSPHPGGAKKRQLLISLYSH